MALCVPVERSHSGVSPNRLKPKSSEKFIVCVLMLFLKNPKKEVEQKRSYKLEAGLATRRICEALVLTQFSAKLKSSLHEFLVKKFLRKVVRLLCGESSRRTDADRNAEHLRCVRFWPVPLAAKLPNLCD